MSKKYKINLKIRKDIFLNPDDNKVYLIYDIPEINRDSEDIYDQDIYCTEKSINYKGSKQAIVCSKIQSRENADDDDSFTKGETYEDEKKEQNKYKKPINSRDPNSWIQKYFRNNNYSVLDNEGGGDCFFAVIRDGFKNINKDVSVEKLRKVLTEKTTQEQYKNYRERYTILKNEIKDIKRKMKKTEQENKIYKKRLVRDLKEAKRNWSDISWMSGITSLDQLKSKMFTCNFWADSVTTDVLELALNTKFIVISSVNWRQGLDPLICGNFVQHEVEEKGYFNPKYYIIMEHTGNHYKLIKYKGKGIFKFNEIPYGLKTKIVNRCMKSRGKSIYNYIHEFAELIE